MIKIIGLLTALASPFALHAQEDTAAVPVAPAVPLVTYDITGTFPPNAPTTKMTAPNAAFYLEFSVPQTIPANPPNMPENFGCLTYNTTFVFEGQVFHPNGLYSRADSGGNIESLGFTTRNGGIGLSSAPPYHMPNLCFRTFHQGETNSVAVFNSGDLGVGTEWYFVFGPKGAPVPYSFPISLTDVVGRVVLPKPKPLAVR